MQRSTFTLAAVWSAILTVAGLTALVIAGELAPGVKSWLAATFFHHWLGKGILGIVFFTAAALLLTTVRPRDDAAALRKGLGLLAWVAAFGTIMLIGFFWYEAK